MGVCSSTDPRAVNRIVVNEFVTASQAQRKWFTKVISKATKGAYQLGAVRRPLSLSSTRLLTFLYPTGLGEHRAPSPRSPRPSFR